MDFIIVLFGYFKFSEQLQISQILSGLLNLSSLQFYWQTHVQVLINAERVSCIKSDLTADCRIRVTSLSHSYHEHQEKTQKCPFQHTGTTCMIVVLYCHMNLAEDSPSYPLPTSFYISLLIQWFSAHLFQLGSFCMTCSS